MITTNKQPQSFSITYALLKTGDPYTVFLYTDKEVATGELITWNRYYGQSFYVKRGDTCYLECCTVGGTTDSAGVLRGRPIVRLEEDELGGSIKKDDEYRKFQVL